jgi:hypothetical protein
LESALGRPSFHALFDHYITIEQAAAALYPERNISLHLQPQQQHELAAGSDGGSSNRPDVLVPPGSLLLSQGSGGFGTLTNGHDSHNNKQSDSIGTGVHHAAAVSSRWDVFSHLSGHPDVTGVLEQVLEYGQRLLQIRANDWAALAAEGGSGKSCSTAGGDLGSATCSRLYKQRADVE